MASYKNGSLEIVAVIAWSLVIDEWPVFAGAWLILKTRKIQKQVRKPLRECLRINCSKSNLTYVFYISF